MSNNMVVLNVKVHPRFRALVNTLAKNRGMHVADLIRDALCEYAGDSDIANEMRECEKPKLRNAEIVEEFLDE